VPDSLDENPPIRFRIRFRERFDRFVIIEEDFEANNFFDAEKRFGNFWDEMLVVSDRFRATLLYRELYSNNWKFIASRNDYR
jgi:hypothetical protein